MKKGISILTALAVVTACSASFSAEAATNSNIANKSEKAIESSSSEAINGEHKSQLIAITNANDGKIDIGTSLNVTGYSLSHFGVKEVAVYLDGKILGNAKCGIATPELNKVKNADGYYKDGEAAGYSFTLSDTSSISDGVHTIKVVTTDNSGATLDTSVTANKESSKPKKTMSFAAVRSASSISTADPTMCIDAPSSGRNLRGDLYVSGWSLSASGVKSVEIYIDGKYMCDAGTGYSRPDVDAAINSKHLYLNGDKSGYRATIAASKIDALSGGDHTLNVVSVGNDGVECNRTKTLKKYTADPTMCIDAPSSGRNLRGDLYVSGWSLSANGVKRVKIYIDDKYMCDAGIGYSRPDVDAAINSDNSFLNADKSGYRVTVKASEINKLTSGEHTLKVVSVGNDGIECSRTRTLKKYVADPTMCIDAPSNDVNLRGDLYVSGWSLSANGVKSVKIYIDGKYICDAGIGYSRPDVDAAINSDNSFLDADKSGYRVTVKASEINKLTSGEHTLKVVSTGNDGIECTRTRTLKKYVADPTMCIDAPSNDVNLRGDLYVSGWSLSANGVKSVKIYIDGKYICDAGIGFSRPDVDAAINSDNSYLNADKSGYRVIIPASKINTITSGNHTLKVVSTGNDGIECSRTRTLKKYVADPTMCIDAPSNDVNLRGDLYVSGWSLSANGVKNVKVYIDGKYICDAGIGFSRPDVDAAINSNNSYLNADKSGYRVTIEANKLSTFSNGEHTLKVVSTGNDGIECSRTRTLKKYVADPTMYIDTPSDGSNLKGDLGVYGWSVSSNGIKKVSVYVDDKYICDATIGFSRPDVNNAVNSNNSYLNADKSGYRATIKKEMLAGIANGEHTLKVVSLGADNVSISRSISLKKASGQIVIDSARIDSDGNLDVSGWSVSSASVKSVTVKVNGKDTYTASIGHERNDVENIINKDGRYLGAKNSGFSITVPKSKLSKFGIDALSVEVISTGFDNLTNTATKEVSGIPNASYTNYNITVSEMLDKYNKWAEENNFNKVDINYLDPEKVIANSGSGLYQFLKLDYSEGFTAAQINKMLENAGVLKGHGQAFIDAGKEYNINPVYLAAHARIESGNGSSKLSVGVEIDGVKYYNQFGFGAVDKDPVKEGSEYAQKHGWNTIDKSISGGAKVIAGTYIHGGKPDQNTLYEMRFDPEYFEGKYSKVYCYAADKNWAHGIASIIYDFKDLFDGIEIHFDIPKFK